MAKEILTQSELKKLLHYNSDTGIFTRKIKTAPSVSIGDMAGTIAKRRSGIKYIQINVKGKIYLGHRLAWLYVHGQWPIYQIDHIDRNGINNVLTNLRDVPNSVNSKNKRMLDSNKSGITGVSWDKFRKKWVAQIDCDNKHYTIGRFEDFFEAICARKSAEVKYGYHPNHGI